MMLTPVQESHECNRIKAIGQTTTSKTATGYFFNGFNMVTSIRDNC